MATYFGINSNYASTLFSSGSTNNSGNGLYGLLSEYSSVKSGSYKKLLNAYYAKTEGKGSVDKTEKKNISTSRDDTKALTSMKNSADALKEATAALSTSGSKSVFTKESVTDKDGNTSQNYNTDNIYKAVKSFVDGYNNVLDTTSKSNTSSIVNNVKSMITETQSNSDLLKKVGITVNSDSTLTIDEDTFKKSDMTSVKSLFGSTGSYGYQIGVKASMIEMNAASEANKSNTYNSYGSYNYNYTSGDLYNSLF